MDNIYLVLKILISIIFFIASIVMIILCTKAEKIKDEFASVEKMITQDLARLYQTSSIASKFIIELVLARYSIDLRKFL